MECYNPKLPKQRSCSFFCFNSNNQQTSQFTRGFDTDDEDYYCNDEEFERPTNLTKWRTIWRRIVREKRKIFYSGASNMHEPYYDAYTYAQNFDDGSAWVEPENLSRSFSARFAVQSRLVRRVI